LISTLSQLFSQGVKLDYELTTLPFPPRVFDPEYVKINELGTIPFFVDGEATMTESW